MFIVKTNEVVDALLPTPLCSPLLSAYLKPRCIYAVLIVPMYAQLRGRDSAGKGRSHSRFSDVWL